MTTFVLLRIEDDDEARELIEDMREYPGEPLLTPVQENTVCATVESARWDSPSETFEAEAIQAAMTAAEQEQYVWPWGWPQRHDHPHDRLDCKRCGLEAEWVEKHLDCYCVDQEWERVDTGPGPFDQLVWYCTTCLRVQGPAYSGPTP